MLTYDGLILRPDRSSAELSSRITREGGRRGEIYSKLAALRDKHAGEIRRVFRKYRAASQGSICLLSFLKTALI